MLIKVHVKANSKKATITKVDKLNFEAKVDEKAMNGLANKRLVELLSEYFKVPKSKIHIVKGFRSREKMIEVIF